MKLFWRIFLSFWLATILMIAIVLIKGEILPLSLTLPGDRETKFEPELAASALTQAAELYELKGSTVLSSELRNRAKIRHGSLFLFGPTGEVLAGDGTPPAFYGHLARQVLENRQAEIVHSGFRNLFVCPIQTTKGQRYAAVLTAFDPATRLLSLRFWLNLTIAMLPTALVCMALSLYLTRPITGLRMAASRLAGGDLNARATRHEIVRSDELGDLARDFDSMAAQIQSLMTAQRRFVADVSHELGSPLTRMHLALALLRRQYPGKNNGELARLERETDKLSKLVQQLLLLASLEAGQCPAETLVPVSIRSLGEDVIEDANFEAQHAGCRITGLRQDATLLLYPQLLRRAIDNVLRNAIRYTPRGSEIRFDCRLVDDRRTVILEIADCGTGVPESMLADIFRPFFRTAPGREMSSGGTGLGLAIAAEAVRLHRGTITAGNRKGGGLQVTITLPVRVPAPEPEAPQLVDKA